MNKNQTQALTESSDGVAVRRAALSMLGAVLRRGQALSEALAVGRDGLTPRDRRFAHAIVAETLRHLGEIDHLVDHCLDHDLPARAGPIRDILRISTAQLLFIGVPAHAAVDGAVRQLPANNRYRGLVNAVLRRLARDGADLLAAHPAQSRNLPDWLRDRWRATYGAETTDQIQAVLASQPPLDFTLKRSVDAAEIADRLAAQRLPTGSLRRQQTANPVDLAGYQEGHWWIQDAAAALPAKLLGAVAGKRVFDLCAAPGGKTAQLIDSGGQVTAVDRSRARLQRLRDNLSRLDLRADCVEADVTAWRPDQAADAVLLDAPCTGTGTLRRHPDIAWTKKPEDLAGLIAAQDRLLAAAVALTKPGGVIVYCTCSMEPEEGEHRIDALIAGGAPIRRVPLTPADVFDLDALVTDTGDLRTLPCHLPEFGGIDGFYACRLQRI